MAHRCPASRPLGVARLMEHRFFIMPDGVASVRPAQGGVVHGLLWDLALADVPALDAYEDVAGGHYGKIVQPVVKPGGTAQALIYLGRATAEGKPRPGYLDNIIANGTALGFPAPYLRELSDILRGGTRGPVYINGPDPDEAGPVAGVRPRFATPQDRR